MRCCPSGLSGGCGSTSKASFTPVDLALLKRMPHLVRSYFVTLFVAYIGDC